MTYTARMQAARTADEGRRLISQHAEEINTFERSLGLVPSVGNNAGGYLGGIGFSTLDAKQRTAMVRRVESLDKLHGDRMRGLVNDGLAMHQAFERLLAGERQRQDSCCPAPSGDPEHGSRLDAQRVTLEFGTRSARRVDAGKKPIAESPLFGGPAQGDLFS